MSQNYYQERRSYLAFLFFLMMTACVISFSPIEGVHYGLLSVFWGLFGFLRLAYLLENKFQNFSSFLHLPTQILFGISNEENDMRGFIMRRLERLDVLFWFSIMALFIGWALYCSFNPIIFSAQNLQGPEIDITAVQTQYKADIFTIMMAMSQYSLVGIIMFLSLTYAHSRRAVGWAIKSIIPLFFVLLGLVYLLIPIVDPVYYPDLDVLKGGGYGAANNIGGISSELMQQSGSGLFRRFINFGWVGAYGIYVAFIPIAYLLMRNLLDVRRSTLRPLIGLILMALMLCVDVFFVVAAPFLNALMLLGFASLALCWGAALSGRYHHSH